MKKIEVSDNLYNMIQCIRDKFEEDYHCKWEDDEVIYSAIRELMENRSIVE